MRISTATTLLEKIIANIQQLAEDGEPTNVTGGVAKTDLPLGDKPVKRKELEDDELEEQEDDIMFFDA